jgi:hypothetical protein
MPGITGGSGGRAHEVNRKGAAMTDQISEITDLTDSEVRQAVEEGRLRDYAAKKAAPRQLTRADLQNMSAKAINQADRDGQLEDLKGGKTR